MIGDHPGNSAGRNSDAGHGSDHGHGSDAGRGADAELDNLLRRAADAPVDYPPGLVSRSLATVRAERESTGPFELRQDGGLLRVSTPAVTALVKRLGAEFCTALGGLRPQDVRVSAEEVRITVAVGYGTPAERAGRLGAALTEALDRLVGSVTPAVTVHLGDVYLDDAYGQSD